ncbi:carboxynorspermidine decarboxylase [Helicobacter sp. 23-1045]
MKSLVDSRKSLVRHKSFKRRESFESVAKIAKKLKNPCYILEEAKLQENLEILGSVKAQSGAKVLLALKGFAFWSSFEMVAKYLDGITASGYYEARLGLEEFRKYNKKAVISVFSPAFTAREVRQIAPFANHIIFNSFNQLAHFRDIVKSHSKKAHLALRLNPLYSEVEPEIYNPCAKFSRLGITPDEFEKGVKTHGLKGIKGLHFHTHCEQNSDALERTIEAIERHFGKYLAQMEWINFGGGHHITRKDYDLNRLVRVILRFRKKYNVEVILEPGEAIGWQCGVLVGEVVDIVRNGVDIAITNLSAATQMPDCLEMPYTPEILGAKILNGDLLDGNLSLEKHSADFEIFGASQTASLVSAPKISKNHESHPENPSVVLNAKNADSALDSANRTKIAESNEKIAESNNQNTNSSIVSEKSGLCSCERENRTNGSLTKRTTNLPDLSPQDEFATARHNIYRLGCPSCLAGDIIGDYEFEKPLKIGDKIIIKDMIHYTIVKNNSFNGIPLPSLAILKKNGKLKIVRKFGYNDYKKRNG